MQQYNLTAVINPYTKVHVANVPVTVTTYPALAAVTVYADSAGLTPLTQPLYTDISGIVSFYAPDGWYQIIASPYGAPPIIDNAVVVSGGAGSVGPAGAAGQIIFPPDGDQGEDGMPIPGPQGMAGASGAPGIPGVPVLVVDGEDGQDGMPGTPGASGKDGAAGTQGVQGNPGVSVLVVDGEDGQDGFSIPGTQGIQGVQGNPGTNGTIGYNGAPGLDGADGEDGMPIPGANGQPGTPGTNGGIGPQGVTAIGIMFDGQDGEDGQMGATGKIGNTGLQGAPGVSVLCMDGDQGDDGQPIPAPPVVNSWQIGFLGVGTPPVSNAFEKIAAGTATIAPVVCNAGTLLTSAVAGAQEFDGVNSYITNETSSGRGLIPVEQYFHLTAAGGGITTIANFFGTTSNISLVSGAYYDIEIMCWFTMGSTGSVVTWTLTNSSAPTYMDLHYEMSPATGIVAPPGTATLLVGHILGGVTAAQTVVTGSLTASTKQYCRFRILLQNGTGTSLKIQATETTQTTALTPNIGSFWTCKRMPPGNVGTFAA